MAVADLIKSVVGGSPREKLINRSKSKRAELDKIDKDMAELDKELRKLWARQDLDGEDVTKQLEALAKKRAGLAEQRERTLVAIEELDERGDHAQAELERQEYLTAVAEVRDLNQDVEQLDAEYRAAAAAFFAAAARSTAHDARHAELHRIIQRYTDRHPVADGDWVEAIGCERPYHIEWDYHTRLRWDQVKLEVLLRVMTHERALGEVKIPAAEGQIRLDTLSDYYSA